MHYGRRLLEGYSERVAKGDIGDADEIIEKLSQIKADIVLSAVVFKALVKEGVKIEDILIMQIETVMREGLTEEDKIQMRKIFSDNRKEYPEELRETTSGDFENILSGGDREFYVMRRNGEIIAFARFDRLENGNLYIGSLNVRPEIHSLTVGGTFLEHIIREKNRDHTLEAEVFSQNKMLPNYTGKFGFKIVGDIPNYHGTGELFYKMEIPKGSRT